MVDSVLQECDLFYFDLYYIMNGGYMTIKEYQEYLKELEIIDIQQQRADIDYIALMTGVDLEV